MFTSDLARSRHPSTTSSRRPSPRPSSKHTSVATSSNRGTDGSECRWARVLAYDPPTPDRFVFSWDISPYWQVETDEEKTSEVEVTFTAIDTADGSGTRVDIEHRHLDRHGDDWTQVRDGISADEGGLCRANMQTQGSARAATGVYRPLTGSVALGDRVAWLIVRLRWIRWRAPAHRMRLELGGGLVRWWRCRSGRV